MRPGLNGHLSANTPGRHDDRVWRKPEPVLDRETLDGMIRKLMSIEAKVDYLIEELIGPGGEEEADT